jgi:NAD(P)-dependent dehydrogenase (short-subunit alcohol dehydrogenase family)
VLAASATKSSVRPLVLHHISVACPPWRRTNRGQLANGNLLGTLFRCGEHQTIGCRKRRVGGCSEGLERMFATNFLGRFVLTRALLPLIERSGRREAPARMLFVSGAARGGRLNYSDHGFGSAFTLVRAVRQFCLANDLFALSLAQRLHESAASGRVSIACIKLGVVKTNIRRDFPRWMKVIVPLILDPLIGQTANEAARSAVQAMEECSPNDPKGALFTSIRRLRRLSPNEALLDREQWNRL